MTREQQLADALMEMVGQHCYPDDMWVYSHSFMSADELAFSTLVECGYAEWVDIGKAHIRFLPANNDVPPLDPDPEISGYQWEKTKEQAQAAGLQKYPSQAACDAVDAVLNLHSYWATPNGHNFCSVCTNDDRDAVEYPCPTVRAIRQFLPEPTRTIHTNGEG